uniref:Uncharacterized protein n=1 Tax=Panagrolaimus superbus TaxID=310955 RepID=A0A914Z6Y1_9BILA
MAYLENDDEERDLDKETVIPNDIVKTDITNENTTTSCSRNSSDVSQSDLPNEPMQASESESSISSSKKFLFNPDAPTFLPRMQPQPPSVPFVTFAQPQYITTQQFSQGYATHIPPHSLTNTLPPGYILTSQGVGMQHNPSMIQPTFIPQQIQYVPTGGVPMYNQQIVASSQGGGGYPSFIHQSQQPQTFVVRGNYDITNGGGYIQTNHHQPPQQLQYAAMPLQYQPPPQSLQQQHHHHHLPPPQQQQFQPQLPYSQQQPPNGLRRYGPN